MATALVQQPHVFMKFLPRKTTELTSAGFHQRICEDRQLTAARLMYYIARPIEGEQVLKVEDFVSLPAAKAFHGLGTILCEDPERDVNDAIYRLRQQAPHFKPMSFEDIEKEIVSPHRRLIRKMADPTVPHPKAYTAPAWEESPETTSHPPPHPSDSTMSTPINCFVVYKPCNVQLDNQTLVIYDNSAPTKLEEDQDTDSTVSVPSLQ